MKIDANKRVEKLGRRKAAAGTDSRSRFARGG
jgi:hypothetical protein